MDLVRAPRAIRGLLLEDLVPFAIARWSTFHLTKARLNPSILKHLIAAGITTIVMYYTSTVFPVNYWYDALAYLLISLAGFLSILYSLGEFTARDVRFFLNTLNIKKLGHYVRGELSAEDKDQP